MQIKKYFLLVLIVFIMAGCAAPRLTVISQAGAPMPEPYYVATSTSSTQIRATYYYVGLVEVRDADHSSQYTPVYLNRNIKNIEKEAFKELQLILQVYNPTKTTYVVETLQEVQLKKNKKPTTTRGVIAVSNLEYRQYMFQLPFEKGKNLHNTFLISEDDKEIYMQTGTFIYQVD